ncbi:hypothetical protein PMIN03_009244 [Paraphaeosphaeria minitans]
MYTKWEESVRYGRLVWMRKVSIVLSVRILNRPSRHPATPFTPSTITASMSVACFIMGARQYFVLLLGGLDTLLASSRRLCDTRAGASSDHLPHVVRCTKRDEVSRAALR